MNKLRELLRILPCRQSALQQFRGYVLEAVRLGEGKTAAQADEMIFLLRAQKHLLDLNLRYFPQSGMSEKEVIEATAKRVGFNMPKVPPGASPSSSSAPSS